MLSAVLGRAVPENDGAVGTRLTRRADIQGLRAIAVILVVLDHAHVPGCAGGFEGVDVFFVISGFVITQSLLGYPDAPLRHQLGLFYARRIRRIIPAATVALCFTLVVAFCFLRSTFPPNLIGDVRWATFFGENFRLTATSANYFIPGLAPSLVTQFWSLAVEEQFYAVFPLLFFATAFLARERRMHVLRVMLSGAIVLSALWSWHATSQMPIAAYYSPFTRFWELAAGALLAVLPQTWKWQSHRAASVASVVGVAGIALGLVAFTATTAYPGILAGLPCASTGLLLFTGRAHQTGPVQRVLSTRPAQFFGNISYSWYLFHYVWLVLPLYIGTGANGRTNRALEVLGGLGCAIASYYLVENPLRRATWLTRDPWMSLALLVAAMLLVVDATLLVQHLLPATI
jgi:peptidoglycan/LPS O-acetylase OafA/YrhL